jgi:nicotinate-nucleotide adenylyltransferase
MNTLLYFGTFNPIHLGHLQLANTAQKAGGFQQTLFIPAFSPPNKADVAHTLYPYTTRVSLLQTAVKAWKNPTFQVSTIEQTVAQQQNAPSRLFTADVLEALFKQPLKALKEKSLSFLMGSDTFTSLPLWHRWEELSRIGHFWVAHRPQATEEHTPVTQLPWVLTHNITVTPLPMEPLPISATGIRRAIAQANWATVAQCVPAEILPLLRALPVGQVIA